MLEKIKLKAIEKTIIKTVTEQQKTRSKIANNLLSTDDITVVLSGTSNPMSPIRSQSATAIFVGGKFLLFDCGDGAERAMESQNLPMNQLDAVFLTYFHADHYADLGEVIDRSYIMGRRRILTIYGPTGTDNIVNGFMSAYAKEYAHRTEHHGEEMMPPKYAGAKSVEFDSNKMKSEVYVKDGVAVRAFKTDHPPVEPNFGYTLEYKGKKIVISGDTIKTDNLIDHLKNADLLVGDAMNKEAIKLLEKANIEIGNTFMGTILADIREYHLDISELGQIAQEGKVKRLALNHFSPPPQSKTQMKRLFLKPIKEKYKGEIIAGDDGTWIIIPV